MIFQIMVPKSQMKIKSQTLLFFSTVVFYQNCLKMIGNILQILVNKLN